METAELSVRPRTAADDERAVFLRDVVEGLRRPQKTVPAKYFYDAEGSRLFDRICELPEYYPTRTETGILRAAAPAIADHAGPDAVLVEFGSGSSTKVRILLDALHRPAAYVPIDISGAHMQAAAAALRRDYTALRVTPVHADFTRPLTLPDAAREGRTIGFFPGSTIGNFEPPAAEGFLRHAAAVLGPGSSLVVGVDLKKDPARLNAAYNDAEGVTAAFNLNLLKRINRELSGTFDVAAFRHRAFYDAGRGRVEMHLESRVPQSVRVAGDSFAFRAGETIHTENSCKYDAAEFTELARRAGWRSASVFVDNEALFSVHLLVREDAASA